MTTRKVACSRVENKLGLSALRAQTVPVSDPAKELEVMS